MRGSLRFRRSVAMTGVGVLAAMALGALPAQADTAPVDPALPTTVTADALPTVQINGVVWNQQIVGNTVYVGGNFTSARPAGSAKGTNEVPRANMLAYNLTTGALIASFAPVLNGQVKDLALSPDGATLYAAGAFTTVNGQNRYRVAAFSTATGALSSTFRPTVNASVNAIAATSTAVVFGGSLTSVNGAARNKVAAVNPSTGATLPFSPTIPNGTVQGIAAAPDQASVVIAGSFTSVNGSSDPGYGLARLDIATGASLALPVNSEARNAGTNAAMLTVETDGVNFYGTGFHFGGAGNVEGTFAADWATGNLVWIEDCHGDTYSAFPAGGAVYQASHKHYCGNSVGGFPQTDPWTYYRGTAVSKAVMGVNKPDIYGYPDHPGTPSPKFLNWYPTLNAGTFTGKTQGPWTVNGNDDYVLMGGEFTTVNGVGQEGLVRFATSAIAPDLQGPRLSGSLFPLSAASFAAGTVRLAWRTNFDRDNETLKYSLYRTSTASPPIYEETVTTPFFDVKQMGFMDTGLTPGSSQRYRIVATDPFGNIAQSNFVTVTVSADGSLSEYAASVLGDGPDSFWRLGESTGPNVFDWSGFNDATASSGVTRGVDGAIGGDTDAASRFDGTSNGLAAAGARQEGPQVFAIEAWFRTTTTSGGKIVGFGNSNTGNSSSYDRHVYMEPSGQVTFGVYPGGVRTITSGSQYNDGQWHQVVASLASDGMKLYVDGTRVAQRADTTSAQPYQGFWRIGGDSPWSGAAYFAGDIDDVAIYDAPLTRTQVNDHFVASGRTTTINPSPVDAYGAAVYADEPDLFWRLGETSGSVAADAGTARNDGTYSGGVGQGATGALATVSSTAANFNGADGLVVSNATFDNPTVYSEELWFKTTTTNGGKLIGFGNATSGLSSNYDRHVYMENDGRLTFGVWTGFTNTATTPDAYNDGQWHHMVATQSGDGMRLFVDGSLRATNGQTQAQGYMGYWRIGGDNTWGPQPWFTGTIDEVAVYSTALTPAQVANHYSLGTNTPPPNQVPVASFTTAVSGLSVQVDAAGSSDPDGTVVSYAWDFGDGGLGTGVVASHVYAVGGTYTVALTATDDDGDTGTTTQQVTVTAPPPNQVPVASFTAASAGLSVQVDGSGSSDPDGTVASYAWDFGDGSTATGVTASRTYLTAGTYTVTLTVTDDDLATGTTTQQVTVTAPPADSAVARDGFGRTVANGWGVAQVGGAWTTSGTASRISVNGQAGVHSMLANATLGSFLPGVSSTSTEVQVTVSADKVPTGSGAFVVVQGRRVGTEAYAARVRLQADGSVQLHVTRNGTPVNGGVVSGLTFAAGDRLQVRLQVEGTSPTAVRAKVWKVGQTEPATWRASMTDSTASLQAAGGIGITTYLFGTATNAPVVLTYDDLWAGQVGTTPGAPPANQLPVAAFVATPTGLSVQLDGSTSSDPDGSVVSYLWDFGDGTTGITPTVTHAYTTAGTYTVALSVTDDDGATAVTSQPVTVTTPPPNQVPVAAFVATPTGSSVQVDGSGSSDPDGTVASYAWAFGDGGTGTGATASHAYAAAGTFTVTLTVTDNSGATTATSQAVTVTAPPADDAVARDDFARTVANGWGVAQVGGAWTTSGTASRISVNGQAGVHSLLGGATLGSYLDAVSSTTTEVQVTVSADKVPTGGGAFVTVQGRRVGADAYAARLRLQADGSVQLHVTRNGTPVNGGVVSGLTFAAGDRLQVRLQVEGTSPTAVRAKVWKVGQTEPATWRASMTDSTASLQAAGGIGITTYLFGTATNAPVVLTYDDLWAGPLR